MTEPAVDTIGYYDRHAPEFAAQTADVDMEPIYRRFLAHVRAGGRILDAGCGVGRDTSAFADRGYDVVAIGLGISPSKSAWASAFPPADCLSTMMGKRCG